MTRGAVAGPADDVRLAVDAMATRFELVLAGGDPARLRAAGEEALSEITRLDRQLSAFRAASDIAWINARAADGAVRIEPHLFALLQRCRTLSALTGGAFDITIAPLMRAWRFVGDRGGIPDETTRAAALASVGWPHLILDEDAATVAFAKRGMRLDLGAVGKGYAIDRAIAVLREHGVECALIHGGTSSVHALGTSPRGTPWAVKWRADRTFALRDSALSISAVHGKSFVGGGREWGHVIDPRSGVPAGTTRAAAVTGPCSLECDALSTALLVLGPDWLPALRGRFPAYDGCTGD